MLLANLTGAGHRQTAGARAAKAERRVIDRGTSASQAARRITLSAVAMNGWLSTPSWPSLRDFRWSWREAEESERGAWRPGRVTKCGGDGRPARLTEQGEDGIAQGSQHLGRGAGAEAAGILAQGHVPHVGEVILDPPMAPDELQAPRCSHVRQTRDRIADRLRALTLAVDAALHLGHLGDPGPIAVAAQGRGCPERAHLGPITVPVGLPDASKRFARWWVCAA